MSSTGRDFTDPMQAMHVGKTIKAQIGTIYLVGLFLLKVAFHAANIKNCVVNSVQLNS